MSLIFIQCGTGSNNSGVSTDNKEVSLLCDDENDCDGDGIYTSCDEDDYDIENDLIKESCDEDEDGYVDVSCSTYGDINEDGEVNQEDRDTIGVNCDVCPGVSNEDQTDSDEDGVGDDCTLEENININTLPSAEDDSEEDDSDFEEYTDEEESHVGSGEEVTIIAF